MLRQAENHVQAVGRLMENDLKYHSYDKNGKKVDAIVGNLIVKYDSPMPNGEIKSSYLPINVFQSKFKNNGEENPLYSSMETVMTDYKSAAATGSEETADFIQTGSGDYTGTLSMNVYRGKNYVRVSSNFINRVTNPSETYGTFNCEIFVRSIYDEMEGDMPTGRLIINGAIPQYNGKVDLIPFVIEDPTIIDIANRYWEAGRTITIAGCIRYYTVETVKANDGVDWIGEAKPQKITTTVNELVITGGQRTPASGDAAYDPVEMKEAINQRLAEIEASAQIKNTKKESQHIGSNRGF